MATIKSYTDINQSRKLAEILPLESADMMWKKELKYRICSDEHKVSESDFIYYPIFKEEKIIMSNFDVPCWSLAALLSVLPEGTRLLKSAIDNIYHCDCPKGNIDKWFDNPVDACVNMIIKLSELKML